MRNLILSLTGLLTSLTLAAAPIDYATLQQKFQRLGSAVDLWLDSAAARASVDPEGDETEDDSLNSLMESQFGDAEEDFASYIQWQLCQRPIAETFELVQQWSVRARRTAELEIRRSDDPAEREALTLFGAQTTLLLAYVGTQYEHCPKAAMALLDYSQTMATGADVGHAELARIRHELTRFGMQLNLGHATPSASHFVGLLKQAQRIVLTQPAVTLEEAAGLQHKIEAMQNVALTTSTPIWRVSRTLGQARIDGQRYRCGLYALAWIGQAVLFPAWPNEVQLLQAEGQSEAAAAYALADLFDARRAPGSGLPYDEAALVWQVYGKERTRDELIRAASRIETHELAGQTLAVVHMFGHEFVISSGQHDRVAATTTWLSREEIEARFRQSRAFTQLWGQDTE